MAILRPLGLCSVVRMKSSLHVWILLLATGCYRSAPIDDKLYQEFLTRTYAYPPDKCFEATQKALADMKTPVEKADPQTRTIWSGRGVAYEGAVASGGRYSAVASKITDEHRITVRIEDNGGKCTVHATKYEVWHNNVKLDEINVTWAQEHIFTPFLNAVQEQLERGL